MMLLKKILIFSVILGTFFIQKNSAEGVSSSKSTPDRMIGNKDAPITIIDYSSLTCDYCANFHLKVLPYLKNKYINPGYVNIIFREYPNDGIALRAFAICNTVPPEEYFNILEVFYRQQKDWVKPQDFMEPMAKIAQQFGLKRHQVNSCVDNEELLTRIVNKRIEAVQQHQVNQLPFFIINDKEYPYFMDEKEWDILLKPLIAANTSGE